MAEQARGVRWPTPAPSSYVLRGDKHFSCYEFSVCKSSPSNSLLKEFRKPIRQSRIEIHNILSSCCLEHRARARALPRCRTGCSLFRVWGLHRGLSETSANTHRLRYSSALRHFSPALYLTRPPLFCFFGADTAGVSEPFPLAPSFPAITHLLHTRTAHAPHHNAPGLIDSGSGPIGPGGGTGGPSGNGWSSNQ